MPRAERMDDRDAMWKALVATPEAEREGVKRYLLRLGTRKAREILGNLEREWKPPQSSL